jgi:hypothetical protein
MNARRPARPSGAATTSLRVILVVGVAALLGWFVLRNGFGRRRWRQRCRQHHHHGERQHQRGSTSTTVNMAGTKIVVANGSGVGGSAARLTDTLLAEGYAVITPTNANVNTYEITEIYFTQGFEAQAGEVARELGVAVTGLLPDPPPVPPDGIQDANVIIVLGRDLASQPSVGTTVATTAAPTG